MKTYSLDDKLENTEKKLEIINHQYDSLSIQYNIIRKNLNLNNNQLDNLNQKTDVGFKQNEEYFKSIDTKNLHRDRILTSSQKNKMISILKSLPGNNIEFRYPAMGNQENGRYTEQLVGVFKASGWNAWKNSQIGGTDNKMTEVNIIIKTQDNIETNKIVNVIVDAFNAAKINFKIRIDTSMESNKQIVIYVCEG
ncbi:MAG: hypothetical protein PHD97_12430 [Bacteroidales bacterium]|nr:hypothetical protein [Bacteroidales bacterium]